MNSRIVLEYGDRRYALQASWIRRPHHLPVMPVADLTCTADGCLYILTRNHEHPIMAFDPEGNYMETLGADLDFGNEHGLHVSPDDCLWVCDSGRHLVYKLTRKGEVVLRLGTPDYYLEADLHKRVLERSGLDAAGIVRSVTERLGRL